MKTIWKHELPINDEFALELPYRATPLCVQLQNGRPCMWVLVDTDAALMIEEFFVVGTGHEIKDATASYVATWQDGPFVWHLWKRA